MVVAMMLPTTAPALRYVAQSSRRTWRPAMAAAFAGAYLGAWMLLAPVAAGVHAFAPASPLLPIAALLVAAAWELTPWKRRALRHCHRSMPVRFSGVAAVASVLRFGMRNGLACAAACAPAMLAIAIAGHPLLATVAIAGLLTGEKLLERGERLRPWIAATLLVAAALVVV
jgi:predicted metal-binding membrane protein